MAKAWKKSDWQILDQVNQVKKKKRTRDKYVVNRHDDDRVVLMGTD